MLEYHLPLKYLSLLTLSFQRNLEHSVHSKQYKQITINNNKTIKIKQTQHQNMGNNNTTGLVVQVQYMIQYAKRNQCIWGQPILVQGWSRVKIGCRADVRGSKCWFLSLWTQATIWGIFLKENKLKRFIECKLYQKYSN